MMVAVFGRSIITVAGRPHDRYQSRGGRAFPLKWLNFERRSSPSPREPLADALDDIRAECGILCRPDASAPRRHLGHGPTP